MQGIRRKYTQEFKLGIIRELDSGKTLAEVCRENVIHPAMVSRWRKEYEKDPEHAFSGHGNTYKEQARIAELERLVGQLYAEREFLKKALTALQKNAQEERKKRERM